MSRIEAVTALFVAFGAHRDTARAQQYVRDLTAEISCGDCAEIASARLRIEAKKLPTIRELLDEARDVMNSAPTCLT